MRRAISSTRRGATSHSLERSVSVTDPSIRRAGAVDVMDEGEESRCLEVPSCDREEELGPQDSRDYSGFSEDQVVVTHVVVDLERDVVSRAGLLDLRVLDLHRAHRLDQVRRVSVDVDPLTHPQGSIEPDPGNRDVAEVMSDRADRVGGIVVS
jgi:hypothetical protein